MKTQSAKKSIELFEIDKKTKTNNDSSTNRKSSSRKSNTNTSNISTKKPRAISKKVREVDDNNAKINVEPKSKRSKSTKKSKSDRTSSKTTNKTVEQSIPTVEKIKVGRRDRKHNWWPGCDYVWVDGIDHWVSKTAFKNDPNTTPIYTLNNYVQGLDSYYCLHYKCEKFVTESEKSLETANLELKKKYKSWRELSANGKLKEKFVEKYKDHILWFIFLKAAEDENIMFSDAFKKKFNDKFRLYNIIK